MKTEYKAMKNIFDENELLLKNQHAIKKYFCSFSFFKNSKNLKKTQLIDSNELKNLFDNNYQFLFPQTPFCFWLYQFDATFFTNRLRFKLEYQKANEETIKAEIAKIEDAQKKEFDELKESNQRELRKLESKYERLIALAEKEKDENDSNKNKSSSQSQLMSSSLTQQNQSQRESSDSSEPEDESEEDEN